MRHDVIKENEKGFTLIEILVVIVILGILGALVAPNFLSRPDAARISAAQTDIRTLALLLMFIGSTTSHILRQSKACKH